MTTPSLLGLSHVSLSVRDRTAARDFWVTVMGFDVVADEDGYCLLFDHGTALAVILSDHDHQVADTFDECRTGLDHLALAVPDVEGLRSWLQRLDRMGVPHSEVTESEAGHHLNLRAPDDLPVELFVMKPEFAAGLGVDSTQPVASIG
ncbi:VOC family protein [Pedococcus bigeumensis]|uniref:VOC family protein n=1 Tax=Pedococcus bigeumensis TaxID=433644 RepID=UPI002FE9A138